MKTRMMTYWLKLIDVEDTKYAKLIDDFGFILQQENIGSIGWFENIKDNLNPSLLSYKSVGIIRNG